MMNKIYVLVWCGILWGTQAFDGQLQFFPRGDQYLIVGSELQVNCSLTRNGTSFDLNNVYIKKGRENIQNAYFKHYEEENTLGIFISSVNEHDSGTYLCYYGNDEHIQSLTKVTVAEMPSRPENLTCVSYLLQDMNCSFSHRIIHNLPLRWHMEIKRQDKLTYQANCSEIIGTEVICPTVPRANLTQFQKHEVLVEGVNEMFNVNVSAIFIVYYNYSLAKFDEVQDLKITMGTTDAIIQWKRPKHAYYMSMLVYGYKMLIESLDYDLPPILKYIQGNRNKAENITVDGLIPYVNYSVTVWGKPADAVGEIYWSEPIQQVEMTLPDVPLHSVSMTNGSYTVTDCGKDMCVTLYWKNPDQLYWYGRIVGYETVIHTDYSKTDKPATMIHARNLVSGIPLHSVSVVDRNGLSDYLKLNTSLPKSDGYTLSISLLNTEGKSRNVTSISIPDWDRVRSLQSSWVSVETMSSGHRVSWDVDVTACSKIVAVTVYWCQASPGNLTSIQCKENFDWQTFKVDDGCTEYAQIVPKIVNSEDYMFGVSMATVHISGGIVWENFRFKNSESVPEKPLFGLTAEKTSITLHILYNTYHVSDGGCPINYHIAYRKDGDEPMDCRKDGTSKTFPANFKSPYYPIKGLEDGTRYKVCVWSSNDEGNSMVGEQMIETSKDSTALYIMIGIFVPLFVILVVGILIVLIRARRRKLIKENRTVTVPDFKPKSFAENSDTKEPCTDKDSGKGSSTESSLSNEFLNKNGATQEIVQGDERHLMNRDILEFGNHYSDLIPVLVGNYRYVGGQDEVVSLNDSNSSWQDDESGGFTGSNQIRGNGSHVENLSSSNPADTEYVDHDSPVLATKARTTKVNSVSPLIQRNEPAQNSQEYLPHSGMKMDANKPAISNVNQPQAVSNVNEDYVDETKKPVVRKESYENPIFSGRREHFYHKIDESMDDVKSNHAELEFEPNATEILTSSGNLNNTQYESGEVVNSTRSVSTDQLDSYNQAFVDPDSSNVEPEGDMVNLNGPAGDGSCGHTKVDIPEILPELSLTSDRCVENMGIEFESKDETQDSDSDYVLETRMSPVNSRFGSSVTNFENIKMATTDSDNVSDVLSIDSDVLEGGYVKGLNGLSLDTSGNSIGLYSTGIKSMYKNPDSLSLGGGSTISDDSLGPSVLTDGSEIEPFCRESSPEIESTKLALCQDIQGLLETDTKSEITKSEVNEKLHVQLDKIVDVPGANSAGICSSENGSADPRVNSVDSYSMVGYNSQSQSNQNIVTPVVGKTNIVENDDLKYESTHL